MPLTESARAGLPEMAAGLIAQSPDRVWTSPALRCRALADAVAVAASLPLRKDRRLREMDFGEWEGLAWDQVSRNALDEWAADPLAFAPPGGERGAAFLARVEAVWRRIVAAPGTSVVVTHGGPLRIMLALAAGERPDLLRSPPPLGSVTSVTW